MQHTAPLSALLVAGLALLGCAGSKHRLDYAPGEKVHRLEAEGGSLVVTLERITNNVKKSKIEVRFALRNNFDHELRFQLADARITCQGEEYAARDLGLTTRDPNPDVKPKSHKRKNWAFELPAPAAAGTYEVRVKNLMLLRDGKETPLGQDLVFPIDVPGDTGI